MPPGLNLSASIYRGRLAPSPTGYLHMGHARTFWIAQTRAREAGGVLVMRVEDLDESRCRPRFRQAIYEDLRWFGLTWEEGPDVGGPYTPYCQSERQALYRTAFDALRETGMVYPCSCSRQDVLRAAQAPNAGDDEPIYPGTCRLKSEVHVEKPGNARINWRFRVPDGEPIEFVDANLGPQAFVAGRDFGDFVILRHDDVPSYQLAVVVDDAAMRITEVVRGEDLLRSTARQILLYRAMNLPIPAFFHCELVKDENGIRLAKRHDSLSLRKLRENGNLPEQLRKEMIIAAPEPGMPQTRFL